MISSVFATGWLFAKYAFLIGISVATVVTLFALFHPVRVDLKLRASIIGQRAEFWFWYFFGFFGLGTVASRGNQFLVIQLGTRQWRLWQSHKKSRPPSKPTPAGKPTPGPAHAGTEATGAPSAPSMPVTSPLPTPSPKQPEPVRIDTAPTPPAPSSPFPVVTEGPEKPATTFAEPISTTAEPIPTTKEPEPNIFEIRVKTPDEASASTPPDTTPIIPFTFEENSPPPKPETRKSNESSSSSEGLGAKISGVRRKIARALSMIRKIFLKGRAIWRRFSPMGKTLVFDLWNSFWILGPQARIRYGFGEPFLVGMAQGLAAQVGGMLIPWGVHLDCMPVFNQETILIKAQGGVKFVPWRGVYGVLRLLTEKDLWRGLYDLYKWYKSRRTAKASEKSSED